MKGPHFPSSEELERQLKAAKQLRGEFLMGLAVTAKRKLATQSRKVRRLEASAAVVLCAIAVFWLAMLASPKVTEADQSKPSKDQVSRLR